MPDTDTQRLNKVLALELGISRREADAYIESGRIAIDGAKAILGTRVSNTAHITVDGRQLSRNQQFQYIALNKPVGYVCSRRQQGDSPTIYDLLPAIYHHLKPVGRLDKDSSGLLLLSNDGAFTQEMTHPSFYKIKKYQVRLSRDLEPLHQQMISDYGIQLEDGPSKLSLEKMTEDNRKSWIVTMHEGRNRQIRRTFSALGYTVRKLHRTNFGNYSLGDIPVGTYTIIDIH